MATRRRTTTSNFGVGRRESHDATAFYDRFRAPVLSSDEQVLPPDRIADPFVAGDARRMDRVADGSVALVVTSPPYFAGKQYEEELHRDGVPATYLDYLEMLTEVFADCVRVLEPGGRIAVNVANLGRKPYRSLSSDVIRILEHDLGLLLRGELIWQKGQGANGSCAWGSFRSAANPVLRDITERVIIASKGRFDRARSARQRAAEGLPHESTVLTEDFLSLTLDVWDIPPQSARRVGHPAPFPVELPEQLIRLYTYVDDLVLDPFMGSGSTLVAAAKLDRRYIGYDLDPSYVDLARARVADALAEPDHDAPGTSDSARIRAEREGPTATALARAALEQTGFAIQRTDTRVRGTGVTVPFLAADARGESWYVDVAGSFTTHRPGLTRSEAVWRTLGRAHALRGVHPEVPRLVLTAQLPPSRSDADATLRAAGPDAIFDIIDLCRDADLDRLSGYARDGSANGPRQGFWRAADLRPQHDA